MIPALTDWHAQTSASPAPLEDEPQKARPRGQEACRTPRVKQQSAQVMEGILPLIVVLFSVAFGVHAQSTQSVVRIEVTAENSPVQGAAVSINGQSAQTGVDGVAVASVPLGRIKISVTKEGFLAATAAVDVDQVKEWVVHVALQRAEAVEEQITVHATRTDARIQDSPLRVEVLQRDEIEEKLMMTPGDIVMMLNEMGGMRVQTTSPSLGAASVRVQGMRGRYTRFLSDGLPLFGQQGGGLGLLQIPPMDLGQVEVIKGIASALYGAGAMGGVINLIARRPEAAAVRELLVNRTTLGGTDVSGFLASRVSSHWGARLLGSGTGSSARIATETAGRILPATVAAWCAPGSTGTERPERPCCSAGA